MAEGQAVPGSRKPEKTRDARNEPKRSATKRGPGKAAMAAANRSGKPNATTAQLRRRVSNPKRAAGALDNQESQTFSDDVQLLAEAMLEAAKKGNMSAARLLIDLSDLSSPEEQTESNADAGVWLSQLCGPDFTRENLMRIAHGEIAQAGIDIGLGGREPE